MLFQLQELLSPTQTMRMTILEVSELYPALVTSTGDAFVWVVRFGIDTAVLDNELKSVIHKTTIATLVLLCITVYKLLLRERDQISSYNLVDSLYRPNSGEGPATSCNMKETTM